LPVADFETRERESCALLKLHSAFGLEKMQIITYNEEEIISEQGIEIQALPIWKWLLLGNI